MCPKPMLYLPMLFKLLERSRPPLLPDSDDHVVMCIIVHTAQILWCGGKKLPSSLKYGTSVTTQINYMGACGKRVIDLD